jgi:excisionase family DNA binding protein
MRTADGDQPDRRACLSRAPPAALSGSLVRRPMSPDPRPPTSQDEFLTVHEVAALLRLNPQTVRNWIAAGQLPAVRIGRRVRITRADLERTIEQGHSPVSTSESDERFWDGDEHVPPEVDS